VEGRTWQSLHPFASKRDDKLCAIYDTLSDAALSSSKGGREALVAASIGDPRQNRASKSGNANLMNHCPSPAARSLCDHARGAPPRRHPGNSTPVTVHFRRHKKRRLALDNRRGIVIHAAMRRLSFILAALLAPALHSQTAPSKKAAPQKTVLAPAFLAGLDSHLALTYARFGTQELQLDLYRPSLRNEALPAIVCIHGGGWFKGERGNMTQLAQALAARGFVAVTISYRLTGEAKFPAAIQDAKAAVRWLRAHASVYGIDPDAIGVTGLSAGGHLAALLATSGGVAQLEGDGGHATHSSAVQAAMSMGAQTDLESARIGELSAKADDQFYRTFFGAPQSEIPGTFALGSPRHHLDRADPPLAFMTGELDDVSTRADEMRRDMMKLGIATGLTVIPQAPHSFLGQQRSFDIALNACDAFFTLHLKQRSRPPVESTLALPLFFPDARWTMLGGGYAGSEGAQWIGQKLHFAAHHDRLAFTWTEHSGLAVWRDDSPEATSFRPDGQGGFYVVEQTTRQLARWNANAERTEVLADRFEGQRLNRPNDCIVRSDGTIWFTDPDYLFALRKEELKELTEQNLYRYDPRTRALSAAARGFDKPNGLAFSPDERFLYVTDSGGFDVLRFPVNADGTLGPREVFAALKVKGLDGLSFDSEGRLWCAAVDGVHVFDVAGRDLGVIRLPFKTTSIAFAPAPSRFVCVTTRQAVFVTSLR
jgi:sugar lactone lactonase YvrE/acetyl esterase/lipase